MTATPAPPGRCCAECAAALPAIRGRGRPRVTCSDEDSPGVPTCRVRRKNRLDQARRWHRYVAAMTPPDLVSGAASVDDVWTPEDGASGRRSRATILGDAGFSETWPTGPEATAARDRWEESERARVRLLRYDETLAAEEARAARAARPAPEISHDDLAAMVARARARYGPA